MYKTALASLSPRLRIALGRISIYGKIALLCPAHLPVCLLLLLQGVLIYNFVLLPWAFHERVTTWEPSNPDLCSWAVVAHSIQGTCVSGPFIFGFGINSYSFEFKSCVFFFCCCCWRQRLLIVEVLVHDWLVQVCEPVAGQHHRRVWKEVLILCPGDRSG